MKIGVPTEIKAQESRVGLTPISVQELTNHGHEVIIQDNAGFGAGFENADYEKVGAKIAPSAGDIFNDSNMIVKVKEPLSNEVSMLRENQILFTYLHLSAAPDLTKGLVNSKSICIAYETVTDEYKRLPLLAPMSAVARKTSWGKGFINRWCTRCKSRISFNFRRRSSWRKCCNYSSWNAIKGFYCR